MVAAMSVVHLGPFEIHEPVGKGGMGVVHRATYARVDEVTTVAVKFVVPPNGQPQLFHDAFIREAQSAARLHHPNIVGVFDIGMVDEIAAVQLQLPHDTAFIVMEFVDAGTLETQLGQLPWHDLRSVLLQLLDALAHAHALGIVHRDLKPANVLVNYDESGRAVTMLTDFGIARAMDTQPDEDDEDEPHRVAGTPYYMAPEHVMGRWRDEGPWTDVYALGALAWHLTTGSVPFSGTTGAVLRAQLTADLPVFVPQVDVPDGFEAWLRRLLDKDLTQRFRRAADAAWALMQMPDEIGPRQTTRQLQAIVAPPGHTLHGLTGMLPEVRDEIVRIAGAPAPVKKDGLAPPLPTDWRRGNEDAPRSLAGAGLGLFGLRPVPIVGRDAERDRLWSALRTVHATGAPHGAVLSGDSGAGKSRLVQWLSERADEVGGALLFRATHTESSTNADGLAAMMQRFTCTQGLRFENVIVRVRAVYNDLDLRGEDVLFDAVALTERILGHNPEKSGGPRFQSRHEWFAALYRLLGGLTRERPILLWLDDVQWSEESLEFAHYILSRQDESTYPMLVVLTCADAREPSIARIGALDNVDEITLHPLPDRDIEDLVGRMLGLEPNLAAAVRERTVGNPLFAVQVVEDWVSRGVLQLTPQGFTLLPDHPMILPDDVQSAWAWRVRDFAARQTAPKQTVQSLAVAATLGGTVQTKEWQVALAHLGIDLGTSIAAFVAKLVSAALIVRETEGFSFVHTMLRDSLLRSNALEPAVTHDACARALEHTAVRPYTPRRASRVATHWLACGEAQHAFDALFEAIVAHRDRTDHATMLRTERRALALVPDVAAAPPQVGALQMHIASSLRQLGEVDEAREFIDLAWSTICGDRAADSFATEPDRERNPLLAQLLCEEAILVIETEADLTRAEELVAIAQDLGAAVDDPVAVGWAAKLRSRVLCGLGRHVEGVEAARLAVAQYARLKSTRPEFYFSGLCELAGALRVSGRYDEAIVAMDEAALWSADVGSRDALALAAMESAELARVTDRYDDARQHYRECGDLFDALGGKSVLLVDVNLCLVDVESGELTRPLPLLLELREALPQQGLEGFTPLLDLAIAACHAAAGDATAYDEAVARASARLLDGDIRDQEHAGIAVVAARAALQHGLDPRAAWELAQALGGPDSRPSRRADVVLLTEALA